MISRTILTTQVNVLCMDTVSCEALNKSVTLPRTYKDADKLEKAVKEVVNTDTVKFVQVVDVKTVETLYGMPEQDFINGAKILDPETRKPVDENNDEQ